MRILSTLVVLVHLSSGGRENTPCPVTLSILIPDGEAVNGSDGSLLYDQRVYPANAHWLDDDGTHVCLCKYIGAERPCLRQCCGNGFIIAAPENLTKPENECETYGKARDELLIPQERASSEMQTQLTERPGLRDWFSLTKSSECPENMKAWRPEPPDMFLLYPNGSLFVDDVGLVTTDLFCLDLGRNNGSLPSSPSNVELGAIICMKDSVVQTPIIIWIGYLLSVPFLAVTFIVYAIIPELRNIYGKTLMCYVLSLLIAYASLLFSHGLVVPYCGYFDVRSALEKDSSCDKNERFSACAPSCERICDDINNDNHAGDRCATAIRSCINKCICQDGYVRENLNGKCIRIQECPRVKH